MPVTWSWCGDKQQAILFTFSDPCQFDEFMVANDAAYAAMQEVDHVVVAILDFKQVSGLPNSMLGGMMKVARESLSDPQKHCAILYGMNPIITSFAKVAGRLLPSGFFYVAADYDDAMRIVGDIQLKIARINPS